MKPSASYSAAALRRVPVPFEDLEGRAEGVLSTALITHLAHVLNVPVVGTNPAIFGDPPDVILVGRHDATELYEPLVQWPSPYQTQLCGLWRGNVPRAAALSVLEAHVLRVCRQRRSRYRRCAGCRVRYPPERVIELDGVTCCHRCAEGHGVVF